MQVEALAVRLRPRSAMEAADLGVRLCQSTASDVYRCYAAIALPVMILALASYEVAAWLPTLIIWWLKPWLDRPILFVLSRAAFRQPTTLGDLWRAQREVLWQQLLVTLTMRRLSPWRSLTQPVYQLEHLSLRQASARSRQIRKRTAGSATLMTHAFMAAEWSVLLALISLVFWLAPQGMVPDFFAMFSEDPPDFMAGIGHFMYAAGVLVVEPFYVAAGFAMYLNRRAELEAWDIEQELRRAFGQ